MSFPARAAPGSLSRPLPDFTLRAASCMRQGPGQKQIGWLGRVTECGSHVVGMW